MDWSRPPSPVYVFSTFRQFLTFDRSPYLVLLKLLPRQRLTGLSKSKIGFELSSKQFGSENLFKNKKEICGGKYIERGRRGCRQ